jgi:hypothetical protein
MQSKQIDIQNIKSVTFFFPYYVVSGVPVQFLRIAKYISQNYEVDVRVIDYSQGYMARTLRKSSTLITFIPFDEDVDLEIPSDTILVMQSLLPYKIPSVLKIHPETKIVFWTLFQMNFIQLFLPRFGFLQIRYLWLNKFIMGSVFFALKKELQKLIPLMVEKRSLIFPDGSNFNFTYQNLSLPATRPVYVPITCGDVPENKKIKLMSQNLKKQLAFGWLGRIAEEKIHSLIYTVKKLSNYSEMNQSPIKMHIIGEGHKTRKLTSLNVENDYFQIVYVGTLTGDLRDTYLIDNIDILFAMGTSALDGAKLGIPTILLDIAYNTLKEGYLFRWVFESRSYSMGEMMSKFHYQKNNTSLEKAIDLAISNYKGVSKKCHDYCFDNHSVTSVSNKLLSVLNSASFCFKDFSTKSMKKPIIQKNNEMLSKVYHFLLRGDVEKDEQSEVPQKK